MRTTFGQLAIGDPFEWRDTTAIQHGPPGPTPLTKTSAMRYEFPIGTRPPDDPMQAYGTAEPHYPVRKIRRKEGEPR